MDGWGDIAADYCSQDCDRPTWSRSAFKLILAYFIYLTGAVGFIGYLARQANQPVRRR